MKLLKKLLHILLITLSLIFLFSCQNESYLIRYELGYDNQIYKIESVLKDSKATRPIEDPIRNNYEFIDWFLNDEKYDFDLAVTKDLTLIAKWKKLEEKLTITFDFDYENKTEIITIIKGEKLNQPNIPVRAGYEFIGWFTDDIEYNFELEVNEDITITAKWEKTAVKEILTISFDLAYENIIITTTITKGEKLTRPEENPIREGYTFIGWFASDIEYNFDLEVNSDLTLIAKWQIIEEKLTVIFDLNYEDKTEIITIIKGEKVNEPNVPTRDGFEFKGWYINDIKYDFNSEVNQDITLIAKWQIIEEKLTVIFDLNYEDKTEIITIIKGEKISEPAIPSREGFKFIGWFIDDVEYDFNLEVNQDITITLKWEIIEQTFTIVFDLNYDDKIETIEVIKGEKVNEPNIPIRDGFEFIGWYVNDLKYDFNLIVNEDINLIAKWQEIITVKKHFIVFNSNGGNYTPAIQNIAQGELAIEPENPTKEGYFFVGWFYGNIQFDFSKPLENDYLLVAMWSVHIEEEVLFKIFYLNDTHGAVLNNGNEIGLARLGNYIRHEDDENSIFITGGDMLQGQLISNASNGAVIIEILNNLNLDAFVLGNHEFDWGIDVVLEYFNPLTSGVKANFPVLGANVKKYSNNQRPDFVDSHVIIERGTYKIGIIGVMGDNLESSISTLRIKDYYFSDAYTAVYETVNEIKNEVDFILVVNHHSDSIFNDKVSKLDKVQAIFNGHTHQRESSYKNGIPVIQSGANGESLGQIDLKVIRDGKLNVLEKDIKIIRSHNYFNEEDEYIKFIIDAYYEQIKHLYEEVIINASTNLNDKDLSYFIAKLMAKNTGAVFAFQNYGGTRSSISKGPITASDIFKVFPFDNKIMSVEILGRDLKTLYSRETYKYLDINYNDINDYTYYKVATNDYLFYSDYNSRIFSSVYDEATVHGDLYETFYSYLVNLSEQGYQVFNTDSPFDFEFGYINFVIYYDQERKYLYNYL